MQPPSRSPSPASPDHSAPVALTIAGFDTSAGAGLQADLLTFHHYGFHCVTAMSALVVETPWEVAATQPIASELLQRQVELLLATYPISTLKIGLLADTSQVLVLAKILAGRDIPIVLDPVGISSTGSPLQAPGTSSAIADHLAPLATLITPNLPEALTLLNRRDLTEPQDLAQALSQKLGCAVLLTGGHHGPPDQVCDLLIKEGTALEFWGSRLDLPTSVHGTGCVLSSAIASELGLGQGMAKAVAGGRAYLQNALSNFLRFPAPELLLALNHHLPSRHEE